MKRFIVLLVLFTVCFAPLVWAQSITGSGTPNTIPQFVSPSTIGDSPIFQSSGNIGIGTNTPNAKLEIDDPNGNTPAPYAMMGISECPLDNFCGAIRGDANNRGIGVIGIGRGNGTGGAIFGSTLSNTGFSWGVRGDGYASTGNAVGVFGLSNSPNGIAGQFVNYGKGDILVGMTGPEGSAKNVFRVDGRGRVHANGGFWPFGADFAESMPVTGDRSDYEPGDLLAIDPSSNRRLNLANSAYSTLVAGIYSTNPGVLASLYKMDDPSLAKEVPMAVMGIVPCKVSAENGPIRIGDLLVASSTPGHAMKGTDRSKMLGAVVGKALEPLREGTGVIQVLVTLQ